MLINLAFEKVKSIRSRPWGKELASPLVQEAEDALERKGRSRHLLLCLLSFGSPLLGPASHSPFSPSLCGLSRTDSALIIGVGY